MTNNTRLIKPKEYAHYMGWKTGTVFNRHHRGEFLPGLVEIPNQSGKPTIRFNMEAVDRWLGKQANGRQVDEKAENLNE